MRSAIHRIEPQFLTMSDFPYGSAGEPQLTMPPSLAGRYVRPGPGRGATGTPLAMPLGAMFMMGAAESLNQPVQANRREVSGRVERPQPPSDQMPDELKFGMAFARARKMGLAEFSWRGERYTTQLAEEN